MYSRAQVLKRRAQIESEKISSFEMKAELLSYFRYEKQAILTACECYCMDVAAVDKTGKLWEVEIKVSLDDLRQDQNKEKHADYALVASGFEPTSKYAVIPTFFYFAVPLYLEEGAMETVLERFPYAGLMTVHQMGQFNLMGKDVAVVKKAPRLNREKLSLARAMRMVKDQSGTLARTYRDMVHMRKRFMEKMEELERIGRAPQDRDAALSEIFDAGELRGS